MTEVTNETPIIIKLFSFMFLVYGISLFVRGIITISKFSEIGFVYLFLAGGSFIIFVGIILAKKWALLSIYVFLGISFIYGIWDTTKQTTIGYEYIIILILLIITMIIILTRKNVQDYFKHI
jgi:hypothetical protein